MGWNDGKKAFEESVVVVNGMATVNKANIPDFEKAAGFCNSMLEATDKFPPELQFNIIINYTANAIRHLADLAEDSREVVMEDVLSKVKTTIAHIPDMEEAANAKED